jgi:uncharacterized protein (TIGR00255 family)
MSNLDSQIRSMTGFATVEATLPGGRGFNVTLKSVNHRHLDLQIRVPGGFDALEAALRRLVKAAVSRGHVELTVFIERGSAGTAVQVDQPLLTAYVDAYRNAAEQFEIRGEPALNDLLRMPGVLTTAPVAVNLSEAEAPILEATSLALDRFNAVRTVEGLALAAELRDGMKRVATLAEEARALREEARPAALERLRQRLTELLPSPAALQEDRLLAEAALLVDRADVEEELVRLRTHIARFHHLLNAGGELGKQLDFLLQELNREANTLLSKTSGESGLRLTDVGLAIKVELERAREQVQNLE